MGKNTIGKKLESEPRFLLMKEQPNTTNEGDEKGLTLREKKRIQRNPECSVEKDVLEEQGSENAKRVVNSDTTPRTSGIYVKRFRSADPGISRSAVPGIFRSAAPGIDVELKERVNSLIKIVGTATEEDVQVVTDELIKIPKEMLDCLKDAGFQICICRDSVTDYLSHLKGVTPRGWPPGSTWDNVVGCMKDDTKEVVIATENQDGKRIIPPWGHGHGSFNTVLHEVLHAYHLVTDAHKEPEFQQAREADRECLTTYESQPGDAGLEETFAECGGRFFGGDPFLSADLPHLTKYFQNKFGKWLKPCVTNT